VQQTHLGGCTTGSLPRARKALEARNIAQEPTPQQHALGRTVRHHAQRLVDAVRPSHQLPRHQVVVPRLGLAVDPHRRDQRRHQKPRAALTGCLGRLQQVPSEGSPQVRLGQCALDKFLSCGI
jgi:hypothetical protein